MGGDGENTSRLKEYNEALLQYYKISSLRKPEDCNMKSLRTWLREDEAGRFCIGGNGEQLTWGDIYQYDEEEEPLTRQFFIMLWRLIWPKSPSAETEELDLVATRQSCGVDGFTRWVASEFEPFHNNLKTRRVRKHKSTQDTEANNQKRPANKGRKRPQETLATYNEKKMLKFTSSVSTIVACLLPTVAIVVLSKI
ncbi:hypothetical protein BJ878DRAFT_480483 [Calycina marina]|uniref:DUF6594 domain-containing protein n=1 Tax=Calycina marina TaxID=1763456 RepID=A0A9P7Z1Z3_9HELO|nr:hypothetical protein BJ878DRAFT_480483 [Calycina marina]